MKGLQYILPGVVALTMSCATARTPDDSADLRFCDNATVSATLFGEVRAAVPASDGSWVVFSTQDPNDPVLLDGPNQPVRSAYRAPEPFTLLEGLEAADSVEGVVFAGPTISISASAQFGETLVSIEGTGTASGSCPIPALEI